jgi:ATP-dependent RNA helicase RhlE
MKFQQYDISPLIKQSIEELGFKKPTDIQYKAIPSILKGDDVLGIAQTGTGKTAAFVIPILHILQRRMYYNKEKNIKCLVLVPTRELAEQISKVFKSLGKYTDLKILGIWGGANQDTQIPQLEKGVDILVATPGRMFDLIYQKKINLNALEILVLDEADKMLDLGFKKDITDVLKFIPSRHQTLFFSATINETIKRLAYSIVSNPIRIQISPKDPVSKNVQHALLFVSMDNKRFFLERIIKENPTLKFLVFVRTQVRAERVCAAMERMGIHALTIHGGKEQKDRTAALKAFVNTDTKILIATDLTARGIDIEGVDYVVNYDLPDIAENYVHRVGRTGRGMNKGKALSLVADEEMGFLNAIELYTSKKIQRLELDKDTYNETIVFSDEVEHNNWKALLNEAESEVAKKNVKRKKK